MNRKWTVVGLVLLLLVGAAVFAWRDPLNVWASAAEDPPAVAELPVADFDLALPRLERKQSEWQRPKQTERDQAAEAMIDIACRILNDEDRLKASSDCLELYPETYKASIARYWVCQVILKRDGAEAALEFVDEQEAWDPAHRGGLEACLFDIAKTYFQTDDEHEVLLLERILKDYGDTGTASMAMLGMSEIYRKRNDVAQEVAWLKRTVEFDLTHETGRGIMDTDNSRAVAIQRLASRYESVGAWENALKMWENWQPSGAGCGNYFRAIKIGRCEHMMTCLCHLNRHDEAANMAWQCGLNDLLASTDDLSWMLYTLYRDADQLSDLKRLVAAYDSRHLSLTKRALLMVGWERQENQAANSSTSALAKMLKDGTYPSRDGDDAIPPPLPRPKRGSLPKSLPPPKPAA